MARASYQTHNFSFGKGEIKRRRTASKPESIQDKKLKDAISNIQKALNEESALSKKVHITDAYRDLRDVINAFYSL